jgi:hypothetical protein
MKNTNECGNGNEHEGEQEHKAKNKENYQDDKQETHSKTTTKRATTRKPEKYVFWYSPTDPPAHLGSKVKEAACIFESGFDGKGGVTGGTPCGGEFKCKGGCAPVEGILK